MTSKIRVTEVVLGTHNWPNAKGMTEYLKHEHHHNFHITVECDVTHNDREVEFLELRQYIKDIFYSPSFTVFTKNWWTVKFGSMSCEMIALRVKDELEKLYQREVSVYVSEDGVQGGGQW